MIAAELIALLGFELDVETLRKVEEFFNSGEEKLRGFGERAAKFLSQGFAAFFAGDLYESAKNIASSIMGYLSPVALAQSAKEYADIADAIGKGAAALGLSTDEYQELEFVAGQAGIGFADISKSISKITMGVGEAARGSKEWQTIFKEIGVSYKEMSKMSPSDRFDAIVNGLGKVSDSTKRAALAQKIFEEQAPRFAKLLEGGTEGLDALRAKAQELGNIIPPEDIDNAGKLNERLDFLNNRMKGIKNVVYSAVLPAVEQLVSAVLSFVEDNGPALRLIAETIGNLAAFGFNFLARAARFAAQSIAVFTGKLKILYDDLFDLNALLRLAGILTVAFGVAWGWTARAQVGAFLLRLYVQLVGLASLLAANTVAAFTFLRTLSLNSLWSAATAAFGRLSLALTGTTAQFILIAGSVLFMLLALEDLYTFFDGGESVIGDNLGIDAANVDLENMSFWLMAIGVVLGLILILFNPILGLVLILALMVAYLASNWDLVLASFEAMYDAMVDGLSDLMLAAYDGFIGMGKAIADFFMGIVDNVTYAFEALFEGLLGMPDKARSILSKIPGISLLDGSGAQIAQAIAGPGASGPAVDASNAAARAKAARSVTIAPNIQLAVDAKDRSSADATAVVRAAIEDEMWRELERSYDGDED